MITRCTLGLLVVLSTSHNTGIATVSLERREEGRGEGRREGGSKERREGGRRGREVREGMKGRMVVYVCTEGGEYNKMYVLTPSGC